MARQDDISTLSSVSTSHPSSLLRDRHRQLWDWLPLCDSICRFRNTLLNMLCIWRGAFRSFLGHVGSQSARARVAVDLGPSLQLLPNGRYQANTRTRARAEGTRNLQAIHPWVDIADLRMFLAGFDAGERFAHLDCIPAEQTQGEKLNSCDQLSQLPDVGADASGHCRGHAQG
jgi:hypothetical protein